MDIKTAKRLLNETLGYKAKAGDLTKLVAEMRDYFGATRIGSDAHNLGHLKPFYVMSGNVAHMLTNERDFVLALRRLEIVYEEANRPGTVSIQRETQSRYIKDIETAINKELRANRAFTKDVEGYVQTGRVSVEEQIVNDLLRGDSEKAVKALRDIMIYE